MTTMNKEQPVYLGKLKTVEGKYGTFQKGRISKKLLMGLEENKFGDINITINEMKQPDKYGFTHTIKLDTYKPENKGLYTQPEKQEDFNDLPDF